MTPQTLGIIVGGIVPAVLYGLSNIFAKASTKAGIGLGVYILIVGISIMLTGCVLLFVIPDRTVSLRSALPAVGLGVSWAAASACVAVGLTVFSVPLSKLVPLYNMNTLVAVLIALWLFAEWKQVNPLSLLVGSLLIIVGGTLVARS